jgi:penicillin amidase
MADLIEKEKAIRAFQGTVPSRVSHQFKAWTSVIAACVLGYCLYAFSGVYVNAPTSGVINGERVDNRTVIYRDARGIPHIRATDEHDAFFAEGFAQGSDRLFQMDLIRRYIYGQLAEIVGPIQVDNDEAMRTLDVRDIVTRQWEHLPARDRAALAAFTDGVNAAMRRQALPVEFRLLLYRPQPWTARDCLAVTLAISASLGDTPQNVLQRNSLWRSLSRAQYARLLPLSDPSYDVSATSARTRARARASAVAWAASPHISIPAMGSNAWAAGGAHTMSGHALIANDPHLNVEIPGIFYAVEMHAPGLHVAGVTIPGIPGVILGHNASIAWATTNAMVATMSVFQTNRLHKDGWKREIFHVRFGRDVQKRYYRTAREFGIPLGTAGGLALVRWTPYYDDRSALTTVLELDRALTVAQALRALEHYSGPPQNFLIAGTHGMVAYHLAGPIANDPAWGRYVHREADLKNAYDAIAYNRLPAVLPSRHAVLVSANNKMYPDGYPYRLSAMFAPPYRAYRIADLLRARSRYDARYFARMQLDVSSPADAEFAHRLAAYARTHPEVLPHGVVGQLAAWNGSFSQQSQAATLEHALRIAAENASISPYAVFDALRRRQPPEDLIDALRDQLLDAKRVQPWGRAGAVPVFHPFGPIGFPFLNGTQFPGDGDEYTIHVQTTTLSQSFRAVWDAGDWDRGGLSIPSGESGQIGSKHYDDLTHAWIRGDLQPLPFSDSAVRLSARETLVLQNRR